MENGSLTFVLFGLAVALVSNFGHSPRWRSFVLFAASLLFLGILAQGLASLLPLACFLLLGFAGLLLIDGRRPFASAALIATVVLAYAWLKKYDFFPVATLLRGPYLTLGLSYIFFRVVHLLIERRDANVKQRIGFAAYLLYTLNFTTFVSGPIQRYDEFVQDQFATKPQPLDASIVGLQLDRLIRGFFKVNVLAALLELVQADADAQITMPLPPALKVYAAVKLLVAYPLFLYANFSGYIDMVIALARLMRLRLPENFDRPFSATSALDFWNRWHITLSSWFKTYVYNPLLLAFMRRVEAPALQPLLGVASFFVTFFLIGLWHGRTAEFLVFGLLTGAGVSANKLWQIALASALGRKRTKALASNFVYASLARGLNFVWFSFTLFWFWGKWPAIQPIFTALGITGTLAAIAATWLAMTLVLAFWEQLRSALLSIRTAQGPALTSRYARVVYASALGLAGLFMTVLLSHHAPAIVYRAF